MNEDENNKKPVKESFCPICIAAVPLAFSVTTGTAASISSEEEGVEHIERKKSRAEIIKWCTIVGIISTFIIIYFMFIYKCDSCA